MRMLHAARSGVSQVYSLVRGGAGGVSGGTIASAGEVMAQNSMSEIQAMGSDQYYLAGLQGCAAGA